MMRPIKQLKQSCFHHFFLNIGTAAKRVFFFLPMAVLGLYPGPKPTRCLALTPKGGRRQMGAVRCLREQKRGKKGGRIGLGLGGGKEKRACSSSPLIRLLLTIFLSESAITVIYNHVASHVLPHLLHRTW